jgi:AAA domain
MTEETIVLPMEKIAPLHHNPRNLIIFSKPKTGKTSLMAGLEDSLILDLEEGSDYVSARKIKAKTIDDIRAIGKSIKDATTANEGVPPYKYIGIDTITALEDLAISYAEEIYNKTPQGKYWFEGKDGEASGQQKYGNILNMPEGAGYRWHRDAYNKILEYIKTWAPNIIQLGHVKDVKLEKAGAEFNALDLDITGKLKRIVCSKSDSIGYLYRKGDKNMLSFITSDEVLCGARSPHLSGKEIVISEKVGEEIICYWDRIYKETT